jgi:hypothetical protein
LNRSAASKLGLRPVLDAVLVGVASTTGIRCEQLAVRVYVVERNLPRLWRETLCVIATAELNVALRPQRIRWEKGHGVVGRCWETNGRGALNVDVMGLAKLAETMSAGEWESLPPSKTLGFTHTEAVRMVDSGVMAAFPIRDLQGRFRGCLELEGPPGCHSQLERKEVEQALSTSSASLSSMLYPAVDVLDRS